MVIDNQSPGNELSQVKRSSFTREEWEEAVNARSEKQHQEDASRGLLSTPGYDIWNPPAYEEVKDNLDALENLQVMAGLKNNK